MTVTFYGRPFASGVFAQIAQHVGVASGVDATPWTGLSGGRTYEWYVSVSDGGVTTTGPTWTFHTALGPDPVFVGAGDIADCSRTQDEATGLAIGAIDGTIWTAGDNVYQNGTAAEFANCYDTGWGGTIKDRTRPVPGNHDWNSGNLDGYTGYFGLNATDANGKSYYSYDIPGSNWHIVNLDSECAKVSCSAGSAQELWLRADLAANSTKNVIAIWHKPRYSSGVTTLTDMQPFYADLYEFGVDILLNGHDHLYERLEPAKSGATLGSAPVADPLYGIRQFTVGTGGASLQSTFNELAVSDAHSTTAYGVMMFTLHDTTYDWEFIPIAGGTFSDSGTGTVHGAPPAPNTPPVATGESYSTDQDTAKVVPLPGVLSNDTDAELNPLTAVLVGNVSHGALSLSANGGFTYTPAAGYSGPDSFTYKANDGTADSNTVTVSLTVIPAPANVAPDMPVVNTPTNTATGVSLSPTLQVGVSDPDADPLTVTFYGRPLASGNFAQLTQIPSVPSGSNSSMAWNNLGAGQTFEWYVTVSDGEFTTTGPTWTFHTIPSVDPVFVGAGDIGSCSVTEDTLTGNIIKGIDGVVFTTGDNVYDNGTATEFADCYATTPWGEASVLDRTRPVPGNHDWGASNGSNNLDGYFDYFGLNANAGGTSYYSYDIGPYWHIVNLDSQCELVPGGCDVGSPQEVWLKADLAANSTKNVIALWHKPRYGSGATNYTPVQPLWDALYQGGADIVLDGHDHIYERLAPMKSGATLSDPPVADPTYGIRQFTVGVGGEGHHGLATTAPTSEVRNDTTFGIFKLTLHESSYDWVFLPIAGSTFTDSGTGFVHAAPVTGQTITSPCLLMRASEERHRCPRQPRPRVWP